MAIHGFDVTPEINCAAFNRLRPGEIFSTYRVQVWIEQNHTEALVAASKTKQHGRWTITPAAIASRVADKLMQSWKKRGLIKLGARRQWERV